MCEPPCCSLATGGCRVHPCQLFRPVWIVCVLGNLIFRTTAQDLTHPWKTWSIPCMILAPVAGKIVLSSPPAAVNSDSPISIPCLPTIED
jgi:hypothetical protein